MDVIAIGNIIIDFYHSNPEFFKDFAIEIWTKIFGYSLVQLLEVYKNVN